MRAARQLTALLAHPDSGAGLSPAEWQGVLTVARAERLDGSLAARLEGHPLPAAVESMLADSRAQLVRVQQAARWEVDRVAVALDSLDAPVVMLKGCALLMADEPAAIGRRIGDVDLLVPRDALDETERLLLAHGWEWAKPDPYDDAYYRRWMHELPPLIHATRNGAVDVHHTILPPTARPTPDPAALIARSRPLPDLALRVPSPTDLVIHAAAHLLADGELDGGLRNLWDVHRLVEHHASPEFWAALHRHAVGHQLEPAVSRALRLSARLYATDVPQAWAGEWRASDRWFERRLLARDGWGRGRRPVTRAAFAARGHALRMPPRLLIPHLWTKWRRRAGGTGGAAVAGPPAP